MKPKIRILVATQNSGKLREIASIFTHPKIELVCPADINERVSHLDVDESGKTFAENALLKAEAFSLASNLPCLSDDSGLEVLALGGEPGINSNRWHPGTAEEKNIALLERMQNLKNRAARFVTTICFFDDKSGTPYFFSGELKGEIALTPSGKNGFGYDPIFVPAGFDQSLAKLGNEIKNSLSHRAIALKKAYHFVSSFYQLER